VPIIIVYGRITLVLFLCSRLCKTWLKLVHQLLDHWWTPYYTYCAVVLPSDKANDQLLPHGSTQHIYCDITLTTYLASDVWTYW